MSIPASIAERVETFRRNLESYLAADYKAATAPAVKAGAPEDAAEAEPA